MVGKEEELPSEEEAADIVAESDKKWKEELKKRIEAYDKEQEKLKGRMFDITSESGEDVGGCVKQLFSL